MLAKGDHLYQRDCGRRVTSATGMAAELVMIVEAAELVDHSNCKPLTGPPPGLAPHPGHQRRSHTGHPQHQRSACNAHHCVVSTKCRWQLCSLKNPSFLGSLQWLYCEQ
jgi:hypothetical protein